MECCSKGGQATVLGDGYTDLKVLLELWVREVVGSKQDTSAILNDCSAGDVEVEGAVLGGVNT